ncbi:MAG: LysM peptidoglycan-binding domain-containing protein [Sulfurovum sp.]|nr:LysM peptidoglycan-binding domain-containing protein [Sulfurovum sp.]
MKIIPLILFFLVSSQQARENLVDCRTVIGSVRECSPYDTKLIRVKKFPRKIQKKSTVKKMPSISSVATKEEKPKKSKERKKLLIKNAIESQTKKEVTPPDDSVKENMSEILSKHGIYSVKQGDTLSKIALMFRLKINTLVKMNALKHKNSLKIGQKLKIPLAQRMVDIIATAKYKVQRGDTLLGIAKKFKLDSKELAAYNKIRNSNQIREGKVLALPFPYIIAEERQKRRLRVIATAYSSHGDQTDSTPFLAAWNNHLRPGMKVIAVSRDLLYKYGMRNGTRVKIVGLPGYYRVRDKMNKRFKRRIDIYMGINRRKALKWGRRNVVICW